MPPKEYKQGQLFFGNEEIGFQIDGHEEIIDYGNTLEHSFPLKIRQIEFSGHMKPPERLTRGDLILVMMGLDAEKLKQNNWRKMHGMVMHRRCGKRKLSKNGKTVRPRRNSGKKTFV